MLRHRELATLDERDVVDLPKVPLAVSDSDTEQDHATRFPNGHLSSQYEGMHREHGLSINGELGSIPIIITELKLAL